MFLERYQMLWYFIVNLFRIIYFFYIDTFPHLGFCWAADSLFLMSLQLLSELSIILCDPVEYLAAKVASEIGTDIQSMCFARSQVFDVHFLDLL